MTKVVVAVKISGAGAPENQDTAHAEYMRKRETYMARYGHYGPYASAPKPSPCSEYHYFWDEPLEKDTLVVIHNGKSYAFGRVVQTIEDLAHKATKWLVDVVNTATYADRIKREQEAAALKAELEKRLAKVQDMQRFELLRSTDPEAAAMMDKLKDLQS